MKINMKLSQYQVNLIEDAILKLAPELNITELIELGSITLSSVECNLTLKQESLSLSLSLQERLHYYLGEHSRLLDEVGKEDILEIISKRSTKGVASATTNELWEFIEDINNRQIEYNNALLRG